MKKIVIALLLTVVLLCMPVSVLANDTATFGISPPSTELEVPTNGSVTQDFTFTGYNGTVTIGLEDIPLDVDPIGDITVTDGETVGITFYGDGTNNTYEGKITFLASTGETALAGIKVRLTIHVNCTAEVIEPTPVTAIVAFPARIDFGNVYPGGSSVVKSITVENTGDVAVSVEARLAPDIYTVFSDCLQLNGDYSWGSVTGSWQHIDGLENLPPGAAENVSAQLIVPADYLSYSYTGTYGIERTILAFIADDGAEVELVVNIVPPPQPPGNGGVSALRLYDLTVENITEDSADILWETSRSTTSELAYWSSSEIIVEDKDYAKEHLVHLENLEDNTTYYFKVTCRDRYGLRRSDEGEFTTLEEVVEPEPEPEPEEPTVEEPVVEEPEPEEPIVEEPEVEEPEVTEPEPEKPELIEPEKPSYLWAYILAGVLAAAGLFWLWWRRRRD